jgi:hypothetical protein
VGAGNLRALSGPLREGCEPEAGVRLSQRGVKVGSTRVKVRVSEGVSGWG